jgi:hypothetical protein
MDGMVGARRVLLIFCDAPVDHAEQSPSYWDITSDYTCKFSRVTENGHCLY